MQLSILIIDDEIRQAVAALVDAMQPYTSVYNCHVDIDKASEEMAFPEHTLRLDNMTTEDVVLTIYHNPKDKNTEKTITSWLQEFFDHKRILDCVLIDDQWGLGNSNYLGQAVLLPLIYDVNDYSNAHYCLFTQHSDQEERIKTFTSLLTHLNYRGRGRLHYLSKDDRSGLQVLISMLVGNKLKEQELERTKKEFEKERENQLRRGIPTKEIPTGPPKSTHRIIGTSYAMRVVYYKINRHATTKSHVHVYGETGVGKGLIARAIHDLSERVKFVTLLCSQMGSSDSGIDISILFGRAKGFLGNKDPGQTGIVETANDGTLFLDEIHLLPGPTQGKLLEFLDNGQYTPQGGKMKKANIRVISASNQDLANLVDNDVFAKDLFYRLGAGFPLEVPPLRDRKSDICDLMIFFVEKYCTEAGLRVARVDDIVSKAIKDYAWPGNVRQLEGWVKHIVDMGFADSGKIGVNALDVLLEEGSGNNPSNREAASAHAPEMSFNSIRERLVTPHDLRKINVQDAFKNIGFCFSYLKEYDVPPSDLKDMEQFIMTQTKGTAILSDVRIDVSDNILTVPEIRIFIDGCLYCVPGAKLIYSLSAVNSVDYVYVELLKYCSGEDEKWVASLKNHDTDGEALPSNVSERKVICIYAFDQKTDTVKAKVKSRPRTFNQHLYTNSEDWVRFVRDNRESLESIIQILALCTPVRVGLIKSGLL